MAHPRGEANSQKCPQTHQKAAGSVSGAGVWLCVLGSLLFVVLVMLAGISRAVLEQSHR